MYPVGTLVQVCHTGGALPYTELFNNRVESSLVIPYGSLGIIIEQHIYRSQVVFPIAAGWIPNEYLEIVR
jgi:hypothetical protein